MTKIGYAAVKLIHNSQGISQAGGAHQGKDAAVLLPWDNG